MIILSNYLLLMNSLLTWLYNYLLDYAEGKEIKKNTSQQSDLYIFMYMCIYMDTHI